MCLINRGVNKILLIVQYNFLKEQTFQEKRVKIGKT